MKNIKQKQWKMIEQRENNNEKWWTREKKQWKPIKNMEKTVKNDEKIAGTQTRKHDET
jgi:hypothetical protein